MSATERDIENRARREYEDAVKSIRQPKRWDELDEEERRFWLAKARHKLAG